MPCGIYKRTKPHWAKDLTKHTDERLFQIGLKISEGIKHSKKSRKVFPLYQLVCEKCGKNYKKRLNPETVVKPFWGRLCQQCINKKVSKNTRKSYLEKCKKLPFETLTLVMKKRILWEEQSEKCKHCGFNQYGLVNGPYDLHHIDGDRSNKKKENFEVICKNCHAMTKNYGMKGRKPRMTKKVLAALEKGRNKKR